MRRAAFILSTLAFAAGPAGAEAPVLTVYTYDSFATEWGPGPAIAAGFEASCGCTLRVVPAGDGAALLSRLMLEGARSEADVVVGLDNFLMERARATGLFAPSGVTADFTLPVAWTDDIFVPYDWGAFAFVADAGTQAPGSLRELADSDIAVVIQDPRASTPGLGLALWVEAAYGDGAADLWADLADNIVTVTPGWSESYALFLSGEADAVLSYTTSPVFHVLAEDDDSKVFWDFAEGNPVQIEVGAILAHSGRQALARDFLQYLVSAEGQAAIPETNWMFPVREPAGGLDPAFDAARPAKPLILTPDGAAALRERAVADWQAGLAR
ncbi:MAG: thiamine ABC transporter substrate binding subunit [Rubellimicrobium sp.]|nr:thiamine ABC transporter substrate binding subunit [Rubellimicrobium sp.]